MVGGQKPPRPGGERGEKGEREAGGSKKVTTSKSSSSSERVAPGRPDLVGRRFLSVTGSTTPRLSKLYEWDWRAGWIRSSSSKDPKSKDLQVRSATECISRDLLQGQTKKTWYLRMKPFIDNVTTYRVFFSLGLPLKSMENLGFPYSNFLGGRPSPEVL